VAWEVAFRSSNWLRHFLGFPSYDRIVLPDVPGIILFFFAILFILCLLSQSFHPALLECLNVLGNLETLILTGHESALRFGATAQRMDKVFALDFVVEWLVGIN
jgi:hypothetical protein